MKYLFPFFIMSLAFSNLNAQMGSEELAEKQKSMVASQLARAGVAIGNFSGDLNGTQTFDRRFLVTTDLSCNASSFDSSNDGVSFEVYPIKVDTDGSYEFEVTLGDLDDSVLFLYCDFDPTMPEANLISWDDDGSSGLASLLISDLVAQDQYYIVVTGFSPTDLGTFDLEVRGPAGSALVIDDASEAIPTLGEWGVIAIFLGLCIISLVQIRQSKLVIS